jgi:SAM-dependent methyltransferase
MLKRKKEEDMAGPTNWYEDEALWHTWGPLLFSKQRMANAAVEVNLMLTLLENVQPEAHILDLCCGVGRHSLELARRGFKVTGVDRTAEFLKQAREQAAKEGLEVEFVQQDMRDFCRPDTFDAVINLFTSFGYFEDQAEDRKVVGHIYRSLKTGGGLLLDMMGKELLASVFRERDWREEDGVFWLEERQVMNDWSRVRNRWILFKDNRKYENVIDLRLYSAAELTDLLQAAGFSGIKVYGGLDGRPYDNQARRLVEVGHKD